MSIILALCLILVLSMILVLIHIHIPKSPYNSGSDRDHDYSLNYDSVSYDSISGWFPIDFISVRNTYLGHIVFFIYLFIKNDT